MSDAVEVPPWRPEMGSPPKVRVYPAGRAPMLRIRTGGAWRSAVVMARQDWPDGRIGVQVSIRLPVPALGGRAESFCRTYAWDREAMHVPEQE